jgi:hypothetical protein
MDEQTTQLVAIGVGLLGGFIQKKVPFIPNWLIPVINPAIGAAVGHFIPGLGMVAGGIAGSAAVGVHQVKSQAEKQLQAPKG